MNEDETIPTPTASVDPDRLDEAAVENAAVLLRLGQGAHLDQWLGEVGDGAEAMRRLAMRRAYTNRPEGRNYSIAMGRLLDQHPIFRSLKKEVSCVLWLRDDPRRLDLLAAIRQQMSVARRVRLTLPSSARAAVERTLKEESAHRLGADAQVEADTPPLSPVERLKRENADLKGELADAQERMAHIESSVGDYMFSLLKGPLADAKAIIDRVPHTRANDRRMAAYEDYIKAWRAVPNCMRWIGRRIEAVEATGTGEERADGRN